MKLNTQMHLSTLFLDDENLPEGVAFADPEEVSNANDEEALNEYLREVLEHGKPLVLLGLPAQEEDESEG